MLQRSTSCNCFQKETSLNLLHIFHLCPCLHMLQLTYKTLQNMLPTGNFNNLHGMHTINFFQLSYFVQVTMLPYSWLGLKYFKNKYHRNDSIVLSFLLRNHIHIYLEKS